MTVNTWNSSGKSPVLPLAAGTLIWNRLLTCCLTSSLRVFLGLCERHALRDCRLHSQQQALCHMALEKGGGLATNMRATMKNDKVMDVAEITKNRILASVKMQHEDTISL